MNNSAAALEQIDTLLADALSCSAIRASSDAELVDATAAVEALGRQIDALRVVAAGEIDRRCQLAAASGAQASNGSQGSGGSRASRPLAESDAGDPSSTLPLAARFGCRNATELLERTTRCSVRTLRQRVRLAARVRVETGPFASTEYPQVAEAFEAGRLGVDSAQLITAMLHRSRREASAAHCSAAEEALVAAASGADQSLAAPATAAEIEAMAWQWQAFIAPDGSCPDTAAQQRSLRVQSQPDGMFRLSAHLLPEVGAQLAILLDAITNPRTQAPSFVPQVDPHSEFIVPGADSCADVDNRTYAQKNHDAFAALVLVAADSPEIPISGGSVPTLLISVTAEDLASGTGAAWIDGVDAPLSLGRAQQITCVSPIQRIEQAANGAIRSIATFDRVFNKRQRRAITLRDGGCVIPGCTVTARWCEIHHVEEHHMGGPTHTSNGVLLCWHHHRELGKNGWQIRMNAGVPEVRPPNWIDSQPRWRQSTKSPTTRARLLRERVA